MAKKKLILKKKAKKKLILTKKGYLKGRVNPAKVA